MKKEMKMNKTKMHTSCRIIEYGIYSVQRNCRDGTTDANPKSLIESTYHY